MNRWRKIKSVLFDFGGTLDSDGINWKERFYPLYRLAGLSWSFKEFEKYFFASDDFLTDKKLKSESYSETLLLQVSLVLKSGGRFKKAFAEQIAGSFVRESLQTIKRNCKLLERLKGRYSLGIVSNFYGNLPFICRQVGLARFFDVVVDSSNVGYSKPDPRIFFSALNRLQVDPKESVFVGDSISRDLRGAKSLGMPHIWMKAPDLKKGKPCCSGDRTVRSLLELEDLLL